MNLVNGTERRSQYQPLNFLLLVKPLYKKKKTDQNINFKKLYKFCDRGSFEKGKYICT